MAITLHFDPELEAQLVEEAMAQGISIDKYLEQLIEQHTRSTSKPSTYEKKERLLELAKKWHQMPTLDKRTPDEIIGYDEFGLSTK